MFEWVKTIAIKDGFVVGLVMHQRKEPLHIPISTVGAGNTTVNISFRVSPMEVTVATGSKSVDVPSIIMATDQFLGKTNHHHSDERSSL